jgi:glycosyltransferase involved in cell wall biosynthesis
MSWNPGLLFICPRRRKPFTRIGRGCAHSKLDIHYPVQIGMAKRRILIFANSFRIGGSERQALELFRNMDRAKFDLRLASFSTEGPLATLLPCPMDDVQVYPLTGFYRKSYLDQARRFYRYLTAERIEVVQCFDFYSNLFAIPVARLARVPVILGCRRDEAVMRTVWQQRAERWSYHMATGVIANAEAIKNQLVSRDGLRPEKIWVIHNGLDLKRFDFPGGLFAGVPVENGNVTVAVVANLRPEKGHLVFLEAVQRLINNIPHSQFLIVGDGPMRETIENKVKELGSAGSVKMTGGVTNIPLLLRSVDIVVLASLKNEGLPNAVMEAMAAAKPVIATDTGGTAELVVDGLTGYVVPAGDSDVLAERMGSLCQDSEARRKMGEAGRRRIVEQFTADHMARRFEDLYHELVNASEATR